jgi:soluble lytic murein transglycosylase
MYWLWRAYQRAGQPQADALRDRVMKEYPFTYFGLRATLEAQADRILRRVEPKEAVKVPPLKVWLVGPDRARWSLALQLMEAGWFDEARVELQAFALPTEDSAAVTTAWFWGRAFQHNRAIEVMTRYFSGRTTDINDPFLRIGFPLEYSEVIDAQARTRSLDPLLVHALIRQESSYRSDVESPARARGLMQIVPATATEVAQDLKDASFKSIEDLDNPQRNIRFGVFYLAKLVRAHRGNLPLALAAYNAGIGNVSRWVAGRWKVDEFRGTLSSDPLHEIWIEELPWLETNLYVKSILRNFILYSLLEKGTFVLQDPLWTSALPPLAK